MGSRAAGAVRGDRIVIIELGEGNTVRGSAWRRSVGVVSLSLVTLLMVTACGGTTPAAPKATTGTTGGQPAAAGETKLQGTAVRFGAILPITGALSAWGKHEEGALEQLQTVVNQHGGVDGVPLKIYIEDDAANPAQAATLVRKLATQDQVLAIAGPLTSSEVSAADPVAIRLQVPIMSFASSDPPLAGKFLPWGFRDSVNEYKMAGLTVPYFVNHYHIKSVATIYNSQDETSTGIATRILIPLLKQMGVKVVNESHPITMHFNSVDLAPQVTALKSLHVDGLVLGADFVPGIYVLQQMVKQGVDIPVIGGSPMVDGVTVTAAPTIPVVMPATYWPTETTPASVVAYRHTMVAWYKAHSYPAGTTPNMYDVNIHDAIEMFIQAVEKGGVSNNPAQLTQDRTKLATYLKTIKNFPGLGGRFSMTAKGDGTKRVYVMVTHNGQWHMVTSKVV